VKRWAAWTPARLTCTEQYEEPSTRTSASEDWKHTPERDRDSEKEVAEPEVAEPEVAEPVVAGEEL
jgi:hypothetical protein